MSKPGDGATAGAPAPDSSPGTHPGTEADEGPRRGAGPGRLEGRIALVFGAGHLPMAAKLVPLTAGVVARVVAYNALAGLVFGWLYWKRGLEHAMLAHFSADLVLHVAAPLIA